MAGVPQFGKWDGEDNVPYTVYFEKARKKKGGGGKMINPNDPRENPEMFVNSSFSDPDPPPPSRQKAPPPEEPIRRGPNRASHHQRESREDNGEYRQQFSDSPVRNHKGAGSVSGSESSQHQYGGGGGGGRGVGTGTGRPVRSSLGSEQSFERSPVHPQQARLVGRGNNNGSPAREGKRETTAHGTPPRTRMQPKSRDEVPSRHVIPEFGEWNEKDNQSADNYTYIFNQNGKKAPENTSPAPRPQIHQNDEKSSQGGCCCFPWGRK